MSGLNKILSLFFMLSIFLTSFSQAKYCPEKMLLLQKYQSKNYENAIGYIDTVLTQCPDQNEDSYFWHVCGFINLDIFKRSKIVNVAKLRKTGWSFHFALRRDFQSS